MRKFSKSKVLALLKPKDARKPDDSISFYYGGWSLNELRAMKPEMFHEKTWYDKEPFADAKSEEGIYTVTLRVPHSNQKSLEEQKSLLGKDEVVCPIAIAASVLILTLVETGNDLLKNDWCRCSDALPDDYHAFLTVYDGRVYVLDYSWDAYRDDGLWLAAAARKS